MSDKNASALQATLGKVAAMTCAVEIMIHPHGAATHRNGSGESPMELARAVRQLLQKLMCEFTHIG